MEDIRTKEFQRRSRRLFRLKQALFIGGAVVASLYLIYFIFKKVAAAKNNPRPHMVSQSFLSH